MSGLVAYMLSLILQRHLWRGCVLLCGNFGGDGEEGMERDGYLRRGLGVVNIIGGGVGCRGDWLTHIFYGRVISHRRRV